MSRKEFFLKRRALAFLDTARLNLEKGYYDLVLFHVEQALQLYLKYLLYLRLGDYPKTHSLTALLRAVAKAYGDRRVEELLEKNLVALYLLEEAYIASRYLPRSYDRELAERMFRFAENILGELECLEKSS